MKPIPTNWRGLFGNIFLQHHSFSSRHICIEMVLPARSRYSSQTCDTLNIYSSALITFVLINLI